MRHPYSHLKIKLRPQELIDVTRSPERLLDPAVVAHAFDPKMKSELSWKLRGSSVMIG